MKIQSFEEVFGRKLTVSELVDGYKENTKTGSIRAFGGKLEVHPPYQRNFIYSREKQEAVIDTVLVSCPLSVMYWAVGQDGTYEMLDGQQRTLSLCQYATDKISVKVNIADKEVSRTYSSLSSTMKQIFNDYELLVFICDGTEEEKLAWFRRINTAGVPLTEQEMRNAIFNGPWVTDAKRYFSRKDGAGVSSEGLRSNGHIYGDYLDVVGGDQKSENTKSILRQRLMEIVLAWAVDAEIKKTGKKLSIDEYMNSHQTDPDATSLWRYYEDVMEWVKKTFPTYRSIMKGVEWGILYNRYHSSTPDNADGIVNDIFAKASDEISNPRGIYEAVLAQDPKFIHARSFDKKDIKWAYQRQNGSCPYCHRNFAENQMHADHIVPWSKGGLTQRSNLQMLCTECNLKKSAYDVGYVPWDDSRYLHFDLGKWDHK